LAARKAQKMADKMAPTKVAKMVVMMEFLSVALLGSLWVASMGRPRADSLVANSVEWMV